MPDPKIRVIAQPRSEPDFKALARAIIELARLIDRELQPDQEPSSEEAASE
jgi:hypothetical protein